MILAAQPRRRAAAEPALLQCQLIENEVYDCFFFPFFYHVWEPKSGLGLSSRLLRWVARVWEAMDISLPLSLFFFSFAHDHFSVELKSPSWVNSGHDAYKARERAGWQAKTGAGALVFGTCLVSVWIFMVLLFYHLGRV